LEFAGIHKNIMFYDDAISTTPESTLAALEVFKNNLGTILLGGENRGYDFNALAEKLASIRVKSIVLFPDSGATIWQAIVKAYGRKKLALPNKIETKSMATAVKFAYEYTPAGSICLLSTASPSYSIFKNFIEKGNLFRQAIKKYGK
jgi:UDP-N-acetylmuramoylalanine--D-glutamate ligase